MEKAEAAIARLTSEIETIDAALSDPALFAAEPARAAALGKTRQSHAEALAQAEEEWLAAGEALQAAAE